jgi:hypothetical protein
MSSTSLLLFWWSWFSFHVFTFASIWFVLFVDGFPSLFIYNAKFAQVRFWWTSTYLGTMVWFFKKNLIISLWEPPLIINCSQIYENQHFENQSMFRFQKQFDMWPLLFWIFKKNNSERTSQVFQDFVITIFDGYLKKEIPTQHWLFPVFGGLLIQCWFCDPLYMPITGKFYLC